MRRLDGFNRIARLYDPLKRLVFGQTLLKSQLHFLSSIPPRATVLILGGGTGEILLPLIQDGRHIYYVEASSEMLRRAEERVRHVNAQIEFIHGTQESLSPELKFDVIITNFFLDLFPDRALASVCKQLETMLCDGGLWFVSDFLNPGAWWHRALLGVMYTFFNLTASVEAKSLPDWENHLRNAGLVEAASHGYYGGFVKTCIYKKPLPTF